jgi:NAD+ diphosphatase
MCRFGKVTKLSKKFESPMAFSGNPLDRASEFRGDPAWIASRRTHALFAPIWRQQVLVADGNAAFLKPGPWESLAAPDVACVFLGLRESQPLFALDISAADDPAMLKTEGEFLDMRAAAFALPDADTAILGQAKALIDWHQRHRFCPNCGTATAVADGGYRRICPNCGAEHFPRTDPVVIMLPTLGDQCLIGRNKRFPPSLYSALAGFVEPGETVEEAVARELREEVNLKIGAVRYHASQPWPFPSSLMIGCYAEALGKDFQIDNQEIEDARWMDRTEVRARLAGQIEDHIDLPKRIAIAHHLIRDWAEG